MLSAVLGFVFLNSFIIEYFIEIYFWATPANIMYDEKNITLKCLFIKCNNKQTKNRIQFYDFDMYIVKIESECYLNGLNIRCFFVFVFPFAFDV